MRKCLFVLVAAAFLMVSAVPAMAQDDGAVSISGSVHVETFWNDRDEKVTGTNYSDTDLLWQQNPVTPSLDFNFKAGDISGFIGLDTGVGVDNWWGAWNFGAGTLTLGNINNPTWRPFASLSARVANAHWYGAIDAVKTSDQVRLTMPVGGGTLIIAGLEPAGPSATASIVSAAAGAPAATDDTDVMIPKLEAAYDIKLGGFHLWVGAGYQTYAEKVSATDKDYDIKSWLLGLYGSYGFGPITVTGSAHSMKNPGPYGYSGNAAPFNNAGYPTLQVATVYDDVKDDIIDVDYMGWHLSAGWKISDMLTLQAGYGSQTFERDKRSVGAAVAETADPEDTMAMYYINMPIYAAKGFTITPEIGVYDEKDWKDTAGVVHDQGKTTYYGVKWLIRF